MVISKMLEEAVFPPEDVAGMTTAYDAALQLLQLTDRADPVTEIVAKKIIEIARSGERDPPKICARAIKELGIPLPE
jgi:hypothetical protein